MKPGYKTTEFYLVIATSLGSLVAALNNGLSDATAARVSGIVAAGYAIARGLAKVFPPKPNG